MKMIRQVSIDARDRYEKPESAGTSAFRENGRGDANHFTLHIDDRAARVTLTDEGVCLNHVRVNDVAHGDGAVTLADDSSRNSMTKDFSAS